MTGEDIAASIVRGGFIAALISLFGTLVFAAVIVRQPPDAPWAAALQRRLARTAGASLLLALGVAWFAVRAAAIIDAPDLRGTFAGLPAVALETRFGHLFLARLALFLALLALCATRPGPFAGARAWRLPAAILAAGTALFLQAAAGHSAAMDDITGTRLMLAEALHLLAAGAWLGGLLPLLLSLMTMPAADAAVALRRFFPLGLISVSLIAVTSLLQGVTLVGGGVALIGTTYGRVALLKLLLFGGLLVFAALNRFRVSREPGAQLRRSIVAEMGLAGIVVLAAGSLAYLMPGAHDQPTWPLPWRMNPIASGGLLVRAYPTSFYVSPTGFAAAAIVRGERIYQADCAGCHDANVQADGQPGHKRSVAPVDLTTQQVLEYGDGDLFWLVGHAARMTDDERWDLVDYLRAFNRGEFLRTSGRGVHPVRIPQFSMVCADGRSADLSDIAGHVLNIVSLADGAVQLPLISAGRLVVTVLLPAGAQARPVEGACVAQPELRTALAILLGTTADALAGSQFLVDPNGWLRAQSRAGQPGGWPNAQRLALRARALSEHPLPGDAGGSQPHHH